MNYIGSKASLVPFLEQSIVKVVGSQTGSFCDLFAGTGAVGRRFKELGHTVLANDALYYAYVLNRHYIGNSKALKFNGLKIGGKVKERPVMVVEELNSLEGCEGFIYQNYSGSGTQLLEVPRRYFSDENAARCDAIRLQIESWFVEKLITPDEYFFLLTTLLESIDKYANTASVYGAFLKGLKKIAQKTLVLKPAALILSSKQNRVYNQDANGLVEQLSGDVLYLDPPYNHRQYSSNYHILETIARNDNPEIRGITGLRMGGESNYSLRTKVLQSFTELISKANFRYIFLSYNNEGLLGFDEIRTVMSQKGKYGCFEIDYPRFKADRDSNRSFAHTKTTEYLHYVVVGK